MSAVRRSHLAIGVAILIQRFVCFFCYGPCLRIAPNFQKVRFAFVARSSAHCLCRTFSEVSTSWPHASLCHSNAAELGYLRGHSIARQRCATEFLGEVGGDIFPEGPSWLTDVSRRAGDVKAQVADEGGPLPSLMRDHHPRSCRVTAILDQRLMSLLGTTAL